MEILLEPTSNKLLEFASEPDGLTSAAEPTTHVEGACNTKLDGNNQDVETLQQIIDLDKHEWDIFVMNHSHVHGLGVVDGTNMAEIYVADADSFQDHNDGNNRSGCNMGNKSYANLFNDGSPQTTNEEKTNMTDISDSDETNSDGRVKAAKTVDFRALVNMGGGEC
ncbi:hypothetical protein Tco_0018699 [Tanacetum coccineum]